MDFAKKPTIFLKNKTCFLKGGAPPLLIFRIQDIHICKFSSSKICNGHLHAHFGERSQVGICRILWAHNLDVETNGLAFARSH